ncbi:MAG: L-aspartate semialdehyde sulfurtransferase ferredoxin [Phycisphaerales bacterium]|jgi:ABC-type methionine transport system ATPase subunit|nr:L-aspartate semialdehyde sulfurtransferase ferredoxin [Phycisphaerales bacterium]
MTETGKRQTQTSAVFRFRGCSLFIRDHYDDVIFRREPIVPENNISKRCWFTFTSSQQVEQPIIWQMSQRFPHVVFDIRQASVQQAIGIMAVLLSGSEADVNGAIEFVRSKGVTVEPIEKSVVEG